jgi:hypothetical protein
VGPLGSGAGCMRALAINVKNIDGTPLGGDAGGPGAPTINTKNVDGGPLEVVPEVQERPPSTEKMSMVGPLKGGVRGPGAPTINAKNIDGNPPGIWCRRSRSTHHHCKEH